MNEPTTRPDAGKAPRIDTGTVTAGYRLDADDISACMFAVADYRRRHPSAPSFLKLLYAKLDRLGRQPAFPREHDTRCCGQQLEPDMERIGTPLAAAILGCSAPTVRRHAAELGGVQIGDRWSYDAAKVRRFRDDREYERSCHE